MRLVGRGHEAVRATHAKTLEFAAGLDLTERGTCIVAVGAAADGPAMAGPVRITITAGAESFELTALANPGWRPGGPAVVRRSGARLPGTLATEASAAASDLPAALVAALRDPSARVEVTVQPLPSPPTAVLLALDPDAPPDPRLSAELAAADTVIAEDERAARLLGTRTHSEPAPVTGRVLVAATADLPGATVASALVDVEIDVLNLPAALAAAAASPSRAPLVVATGTTAEVALRSAPATSRLVVAARGDDVPRLVDLAARLRGSGAVLVRPHARPRRVEPEADDVAGRETVHLCFDAASGAPPDPAVGLAIDELLADGVSTRTAAAALATLTGWDRRRAYEAVLARRRA